MRKAFEAKHSLLYLKAVFIGLLAGLIVTAYRFLLLKLTEGRWSAVHAAEKQPLFYIAVFAGLTAAALITGAAVSKYPMIKGSGIPQIKGGLRGFFKLSWFPELPLKFCGGLLALGCGLSLGREGPSIQLGGLTACAVNKKFAKSQKEEDCLLTAGSAAGLTAAFGAPLSGVLFTFEELRNRMTHTSLVTAILSCLAAGIVSEAILGQLHDSRFGLLFTDSARCRLRHGGCYFQSVAFSIAGFARPDQNPAAAAVAGVLADRHSVRRLSSAAGKRTRPSAGN